MGEGEDGRTTLSDRGKEVVLETANEVEHAASEAVGVTAAIHRQGE